MKKMKCKTCREMKPEGDFYVCKSRDKYYIKRTCKLCFNRAKDNNARRKKFIELTQNIKFKKHQKLKDNSKGFSHDAKSALRERDIEE